MRPTSKVSESHRDSFSANRQHGSYRNLRRHHRVRSGHASGGRIATSHFHGFHHVPHGMLFDRRSEAGFQEHLFDGPRRVEVLHPVLDRER